MNLLMVPTQALSLIVCLLSGGFCQRLWGQWTQWLMAGPSEELDCIYVYLFSSLKGVG